MRFLDSNGDDLGAQVSEAQPAISAAAGDAGSPATPPVAYSGGGSSLGYEGAQSNSQRTSFFNFPVNCRREMGTYTRKELLRKFRALDANLGIFSRIRSAIGQHSVGAGIFPRPITRDKAWNTSNRKRFEKKMQNEVLYSTEETFDFFEDQRHAAETMVGDGEYFEGLVTKEGTRRVQRFDSFEIESPWGLNLGAETPDGHVWQDGVLTDPYDAPRAYGVRELPVGGFMAMPSSQVRPVPADSMLHVFRQRRAHQVRDLTWFYSGINNGIDALDLVALEKGTAKLHSALGLVVRKKQADAGKNGVADQIKKVIGAGGDLTRVDENFWRGAAIQYMATDEGIDLLRSDRPSPNLLAFVEFLYREIAASLGLPLDVIYKMQELGGASLRASLEAAQWLFDMVQDKIVMRHSRRIYLWDTANAMLAGEQPMCEDPEWWATAWRGPAKLTVDLGRTADAAVTLMRNAALSHVRYYEERNQDAYDEMEEEIQFREWLHERCRTAKIDYAELIEPTPGAVTNVHVKPKADE